MNNKLYKISIPFLNSSYSSLTQNVRILLYKQNNQIFDILDFENDSLYYEPLLFSYFNNKQNENNYINNLLFTNYNEFNQFEIHSDEFGRIYLPNFGWLLTNYSNEIFYFNKRDLFLKNKNINIVYKFEEINIIEGTKIELLKYEIPLLRQCFFDVTGKLISVEIENISRTKIDSLTKAYKLIKMYAPEQFELIEKYAPKCVVFNVDTFLRNSFASMSAQGIGFYNSYQDDYDEIFFVDDIAHQTGHVIFNLLIYNENLFFKINKKTIIESFTMADGSITENRDLEVIFHALYTYYTSFICLDACLDSKTLTSKQEHEALGRISFYINKCYRDLLLIDNPISSQEKSNEYFTSEGLLIYDELKNKWIEIYKKWNHIVNHFDMSNQPYNFTYTEFIKLNPLP